jgi:hypothetical protein
MKLKTATEIVLGIALSIIGFFAMRSYDELKDRTNRVPVLETWAANQDKRLDRMEIKLDEVLKIARDSH